MLRVKFDDLPLFLIKEYLGAARGHPSFFLGEHGWVDVGHGPGRLVVTNPHKERLLASMEVNHPEGSDWQCDQGKQAAWIHPSFCFSSSHTTQMLSLILPIKKSHMRLQLALIWSTFIIALSLQPVGEAAFPQHDFVSGVFNRASHL